MVLLTVRGRKSGQPRTTPVDLFEGKGRSFLVSTHRQESSNWVHNLRIAGEGVLSRGRTRQPITVVELPPEAAGSILRDVLGLAWHHRYAGSFCDALFPYRPTLPWPPLSTLPAATPFSRLFLLEKPSKCRFIVVRSPCAHLGVLSEIA
jgi:deazaflavin-dependent oxidoreductase (nitroreductase family)